MSIVRVEFRKWDGRLHWHFNLDRLGEDEYGIWLAGRPGCALQRGDGPIRLEEHGFACLVPHAGRWVAFFNADPRQPELYIDVTDEPVRGDSIVTAIDLDLDVIRRRDGSVFIDDEDEFLEHQALFAYPADVVAATSATAAALVEAVSGWVEPFGTASTTWLRMVRT